MPRLIFIHRTDFISFCSKLVNIRIILGSSAFFRGFFFNALMY